MQILKKGFTLVELLIVMAVLSIMAGGLVVGLDPVQKIYQANDIKAKDAVSQVARAAEAYAATNNGVYAADQAAMVTSGDLKASVSTATYTQTGGGTGATVTAGITAKKYCSTGTCTWDWSSATGVVGCTGGGCTAAANAGGGPSPTPSCLASGAVCRVNGVSQGTCCGRGCPAGGGTRTCP